MTQFLSQSDRSYASIRDFHTFSLSENLTHGRYDNAILENNNTILAVLNKYFKQIIKIKK